MSSYVVCRPSYVVRPHLFVNILVVTVLIQISWKLVKKFVLMIFRSSSNMGFLGGSKTRSHSKKNGKTLLTLQWSHYVFTQLSPNLVRMLVLVIVWMSSKGQVSDLGSSKALLFQLLKYFTSPVIIHY
jgi:hypothetical protein